MCTYEQLDVTLLEVGDDGVPVVLVDAAVQRHAGVGVSHEVLHQLISVLLFVHEHQHRAQLLVHAQQLQQLVQLLVLLQQHLRVT